VLRDTLHHKPDEEIVLRVEESASNRLNVLWMPSRLCKESVKDFLHVGHKLGMLFWGCVGLFYTCLAEGYGEERRWPAFQLATMLLDELEHFGFVPAGMDGRGKNSGPTSVQAAASSVVSDVCDGDRKPIPAQCSSNMFSNAARLTFSRGIQDADRLHDLGSVAVWHSGIVTHS